jgi:hypothetical protein
MTALYLDEGVSVHLAPRLAANGHPTRTTQEEDRRGDYDAGQLLYAVNRGRTIVTHNKSHFVALHYGWLLWSREWNVVRAHTGILILPHASPRITEERIALEITGFLSHLPPLANECYEWKPERNAWHRYPPPDSPQATG